VRVKSIQITLNNGETYEFLLHKCRKPETGYWVDSETHKGMVTEGYNLKNTFDNIIDAIEMYKGELLV